MTDEPGDQPDRRDLESEEVVEAEVVDEGDSGQVSGEDLGIDLPEDPEAAIGMLLGEVAAARSSAASHLDDLRRLAAEFDNYRKRMLRDQTQHVERAAERVVKALLPVLDSFDLALAHEATSPSEQKLLDGVERTYRLLMDVLGREGVEPIPALGHPFDPELHEAVSLDQEGGKSLVITDELRPGYLLAGRVIRPAMVAVGPSDQPDEGES